MSALVRIGLALVLLFAATMKGYEFLFIDPTSRFPGPFPWTRLVLLNAEGLLGIALLFGLWANITKRVASLCFFIFSAVALEKALHGTHLADVLGPSMLTLGTFSFLIWQPRLPCLQSRALASHPTMWAPECKWRRSMR